MPSKTKKQRRLMAAACRNNRSTRAGVPKKVACEFHRADKAKPRRRKGRRRR